MRLTADREDELVTLLRRDPDVCLTFPPDTYTRPDGALAVHRNGVQELLHRRLFRRLIGELGRIRLDRNCPTFGCCNPHHFTPTRRLPRGATKAVAETAAREAAERRRGVAALNAAKLYCPALHEYTPENTYRYTDATGATRRKCRQCNREAQQRRALLAR